MLKSAPLGTVRRTMAAHTAHGAPLTAIGGTPRSLVSREIIETLSLDVAGHGFAG